MVFQKSSEIPPEKKEILFFWLKLLAVAAMILGARFWLIYEMGGITPFRDDWELIRHLFLPWETGEFSFWDIFSPHNEHRPALIRLIYLYFFQLNKQFDPLLGMMLNALIAMIFSVSLLKILSHQVSKPMFNLLCLIVAVLWAAPYGWQNSLWNFQLAWYLMALLSLAAIWGMLLHDSFTRNWWLGVVCAFLAYFNVASGLMAAAVIFLIQIYRLTVCPKCWRQLLPTAMAGMVIVGGGLLLLPESRGEQVFMAKTIGQFLSALGNHLGWPWAQTPWMAFFMYSPFMIFVGHLLWKRKPLSQEETLVLALGGWVILHSAALSYGRGGAQIYLENLGPMSRYMEILALGLIPNLLALYYLTVYATPSSQFWRISIYFAGAWLAVVASGFVYQSALGPSSGWWVLPYKAELNEKNLLYCREYMLTGSIGVLRDKPYMHIPYPNEEALAKQLDNPKVRQILPAPLQVPALPQNEENTSSPIFISSGAHRVLNNYRGEPVLSSYQNTEKPATGRFISAPISIKQDFIKIPVSGDLGEEGLELYLMVDKKAIPITPPEPPGNTWQLLHLLNPSDSFRLMAVDENPHKDFAFAAPRGTGIISIGGHYLLEWGIQLFLFGLALFSLVFGINFWQESFRAIHLSRDSF